MSFQLFTEILIQAEPQRVWKILTTADDYPTWNPFIKRMKGNLSLGSQIEVEILAPNSSTMIFKPKVTAFRENREFRWKGKLFIEGLFDGEHKFELIEQENGTCLFQQSEKFSGILVPFLKKQLEVNTKQGFEMMNAKIKELAES